MALHALLRTGLQPGPDIRPFRPRQDDGSFFRSPDELFAALDGRDLAMRGSRWHVEVFSVREIAGRRYAQLALRGTPDYFVTVRTPASADTRRIIPALLLWLMRPKASGDLIDIG
jgi:hypothetical protein